MQRYSSTDTAECQNLLRLRRELDARVEEADDLSDGRVHMAMYGQDDDIPLPGANFWHRIDNGELTEARIPAKNHLEHLFGVGLGQYPVLWM